MCFYTFGLFYAFWGPLAGIINTVLWYADSKDVEIPYMAEMRLVLGLSMGIPAILLAACTYGFI